jgi:tetratricopeptide (TPR) repeat protein
MQCSGAVNAYSRALELDDSLAAVWANRAACRLQLGEPQACVEDCSRALELLAPLRERLGSGGMAADEFDRWGGVCTWVVLLLWPRCGWAEGRQACRRAPLLRCRRVRQQVSQVLVRRAAACCELGRLGEAAADYEEALRCVVCLAGAWLRPG